jgi:hypothetical protein
MEGNNVNIAATDVTLGMVVSRTQTYLQILRKLFCIYSGNKLETARHFLVESDMRDVVRISATEK